MFDVIEHLFDQIVPLVPSEAYYVRRIVIITGNSIGRLAIGINWAVLSPAEHLYYFQKWT